MDMSVDQSRAEVSAVRVDLLAALIRADAQNNPITDSNVAVLNLPGENIDNVGIPDDQRRVPFGGIQYGVAKTCLIQRYHHLLVSIAYKI